MKVIYRITLMACLLVGFEGCNDSPPKLSDASNPFFDRDKNIALVDVTSGFQLNNYSRTTAKTATASGQWKVEKTDDNCDSNQFCFDVSFVMSGTSDRPTWHSRFDSENGELVSESFPDQAMTFKYFEPKK